jgi:hypothetical protein
LVVLLRIALLVCCVLLCVRQSARAWGGGARVIMAFRIPERARVKECWSSLLFVVVLM